MCLLAGRESRCKAANNMAIGSSSARTRISVLRRFLVPSALSPLGNPNSENASSSAQLKPLRISNFHFSNSELPAARASNLEPPTSNVQNLPDTPERVETDVSHRKQRVAYRSTRHSSHPGVFRGSSFPGFNGSAEPRSSILTRHQPAFTNHCLEAARNRVLASPFSALLLLQIGARGHRAQSRGAAP